MISIDFHHFLQYDCPGWVSLSTTSLWLLVPCGSLSIRDVLPLELFTCLWFVSHQAPALQRLFSSPSAMVEQLDFLSTAFANWCSLFCTRSNFTFVWFKRRRYPPNVPKAGNREILFSSSWWISLLIAKQLLTHVWKFSAQRLYDRAPYLGVIGGGKGKCCKYCTR